MKKIGVVLLFSIFAVLFFVYDQHETSLMRPQGLHQWRQSIGATYAKNYYNYNLNPTETHIYNFIVDEANSDKAYAEFPVLYYFIAVLYKIFGPNESIFRIVNLLILYLGLFYLMRLFKIIHKNDIWALLLTILTYTSATLVYYSNSFLPDTTSFSISFIGLYHVFKYSLTRNMKHVWYASALFALGGLIKITSLIPFLAVTGTFLLFQLVNTDFRNRTNFKRFILPIGIPIILSFFWYFFVSIYHNKYGGNISAVEIRPIWRLSPDVIEKTWNTIWNVWLKTYYHPTVLIISLAALIISIVFIRKLNKFYFTFLLLSILGSISFFFFFFRSLKSHDYYLINVFYIVIFSISMGITLLQKINVPKRVNNIIQILFSFFLVFLISQTRVEVDKKLHVYNIWHTKWFHGLEDIEPKLREAGIQVSDKVISIPDPSINISLNMMNQPGFTDFIRMNIPVEERIDFQISKGAKYLVLGDSLLYQKENRAYVKKYMSKKVLSYKNIVVYDLQSY